VSQSPVEVASSGAVINASASAAWLAVSESIFQGSHDFFGHASADFDLTFAPVTDGAATLDINLTRSGEYGSGLATLFDVTTQQAVWKVYFGSDFGGDDLGPVIINEEGSQSFAAWGGPVALPTALSAADVYDLHLTSSTSNPAFGTFSSLGVSGVVSVPEPSTLLLLGIGLATTAASRRRFKKRLNAAQQV
jgi:hypothetical protein